MTTVNTTTAYRTVVILCLCLIALIVLLILLYKKLNKEAKGEYNIRHMVYKEGGVRDWVRGAALALETRLGVQLWPRSDTDEGEEMQEVQDEEGQVEKGDSQEGDSQGSDSQRSDSEGDDQDDGGEEADNGETRGDVSGDDSSLEGSEHEEQTRLIVPPVAKGETGEKEEEKEEKAEDKEVKGEASGGAGLLIDLKQFSGSAIWSEDEGGKGKDSHVTAL